MTTSIFPSHPTAAQARSTEIDTLRGEAICLDRTSGSAQFSGTSAARGSHKIDSVNFFAALPLPCDNARRLAFCGCLRSENQRYPARRLASRVSQHRRPQARGRRSPARERAGRSRASRRPHSARRAHSAPSARHGSCDRAGAHSRTRMAQRPCPLAVPRRVLTLRVGQAAQARRSLSSMQRAARGAR